MISKELKNSIGIHHIVLTVADAQETERFYTKIFGEPDYATSHLAMYNIGSTLLFFVQKEQKNPLSEKFDPTIIGLEHLAFGLKNLDELQQVEQVLIDNHIQSSGIHIDANSGKEKIWLNDPSNIRIEFYL
jgi:catechol-2,3-dioxygenase